MYPRLSAGVLLFYCSETDGCVTVRDRDTMEQVRMPIDELVSYLEEKVVF